MKLKQLVFLNRFSIAFLFLLFSAFSSYAVIYDSIALDSNKLIVIHSISLSGNKITKDIIVYRELTFNKNDSLSYSDFKKQLSNTYDNLLNTSLFNFVTLSYTSDSLNNVNIKVDLKERWYLWPYLIFNIEDRDINVWLKDPNMNRANYGFYIQLSNCRGRNETLKLILQEGYSKDYALAYDLFVDKKRKNGLGFMFDYILNHELSYKTLNNKLSYIRLEDNYVRKDIRLTLNYLYRPKIHNEHRVILQYNDYSVADTIAKLNPDFLGSSKTNLKYLTAQYQFESDYRNFMSYPLRGYYFNLYLTQTGFGLFKGESINNASLQTVYRKYFQLSDRFYYASGVKLKVSNTTFQPYVNVNGLGTDRDMVRGYEYYIIDGQHYAYIKNNIKFALIPTRILTLNYLPLTKFKTIPYAIYLNLFTDAGYVVNNQTASTNSLGNSWLIGYGFGLDYVTYYDRVLRIEFSINKLGEKGVFLHFIAPI